MSHEDEEDMMPDGLTSLKITERQCSDCKQVKPMSCYGSKQWKRKGSAARCRTCAAYHEASSLPSRLCGGCRTEKPRSEYSVAQWAKPKNELLCYSCVVATNEKAAAAKYDDKEISTKADGMTYCSHGREECDECCMSFTLMNQMARESKRLGRPLTFEETITHVPPPMKDVCTLDHLTICPRAGGKTLKCPCKQANYCSVGCQRFHWEIHKLTCSYVLKGKPPFVDGSRGQYEFALKIQEYIDRTNHLVRTNSTAVAPPLSTLPEAQKESIRIWAFNNEQMRPGIVKQIAEELGEHPLVIGGGSVVISRDGTQKFDKGDVSKLLSSAGLKWDGSIYMPGYKPKTWTAESAAKRRMEVLREVEASEGRQRALMKELGMMGI